MVLGTDMTSAFEAVPALKELLPKEYGGSNKTFDELSSRLHPL